jgi:predicted Zn-dependent peptidase
MIMLNKSGKIYLLLIAGLLFFTSVHGTSFSYDLEKKIISHTLDNGLKILMVERHLSPTVSFYIRHRVGAVDEADGRTGSAHLLEHMLFKGTRTIGTKDIRKEEEILKRIAKVGESLDRERMKERVADKTRVDSLTKELEGLQKTHKKYFVDNEIDRLYTEHGANDINATTSQDLTSYHVSLPSNKIELWARIEADRMTSPVFREFYSERSVVMEERRQRIESNPEGQLYEQFLASAYIAHPYRRPILGWPSDIQFLDPVYIEAFFKSSHAPNNTVIAIVGDIDPAATLDIVRKYFGPIPRRALNTSLMTKEPPQTGERRISITSDANPSMIIGYHKPAMPEYDDYVFDVLEYIFSKGRTSRLYKTLVEKKGVAKSIFTANGIPGSRYQNLFVVFAKPRHPHTSTDVELSIYEELEKVKTHAVSTRELEKAKNQLKADFIKNLDSNLELANMVSYFEILIGDYRYITNHLKIIEKVTPEDIMRVAKKYLVSENRTVANLVKKN